jgi:hypothetical protein
MLQVVTWDLGEVVSVQQSVSYHAPTAAGVSTVNVPRFTRHTRRPRVVGVVIALATRACIWQRRVLVSTCTHKDKSKHINQTADFARSPQQGW